MRPDHRQSPANRFNAVIAHMFQSAQKPKPKAPRRKRPPCNAWGKRH